MHIASSTQFQSTTPRGAPHSCADTSPISPQLSTKELEILKWCAMGKSSWKIAQTLARSEAG
ncbi:LuxR C-terminal-related transcriptional regulator [Pseudomonas sp. LLb12B]